MDNKAYGSETQDLLREMAEVQRRSQRLSRITTAVIILMAAALIVSLVILVPRLTATLDHARSTLNDTQQIIQRISTSLDNLDSIGEKLNGLSDTGVENLENLLETLNAINLDALTESIEQFNSVIEGLSNFRLFG